MYTVKHVLKVSIVALMVASRARADSGDNNCKVMPNGDLNFNVNQHWREEVATAVAKFKVQVTNGANNSNTDKITRVTTAFSNRIAASNAAFEAYKEADVAAREAYKTVITNEYNSLVQPDGAIVQCESAPGGVGKCIREAVKSIKTKADPIIEAALAARNTALLNACLASYAVSQFSDQSATGPSYLRIVANDAD